MTQLLIIHQVYNLDQDFYIRQTLKFLSLLRTLSNFIIKVIKLFHNMLEISINCFTTYYPYYKKKFEMIESTYNPFLLWPPPKLISLPSDSFDYIGKFVMYYPHYKEQLYISNLAQTFAYITKLSLVIEKRELSRTFLHFLSWLLSSSSVFSNSMLSKICLTIFEFLIMSGYTAMSQ